MIDSYARHESEDHETWARRQKAQQLRYKRPIVKDICLEHIQSDLYDMQEACADIAYSTDDGDIGLLAELIGDEDEAREFRMEFCDLEAEIEQMQGDLEEEWVPECFDVFFVSIKAGKQGGGYLGWDTYEQDYFGIGADWIAEDEAAKQFMRLTKKEMLNAAHQCFKVYGAYIGLKVRYENLKAAYDVLFGRNMGHIETIKKIDEEYQKAQEFGNWSAVNQWDTLLSILPQEVWAR